MRQVQIISDRTGPRLVYVTWGYGDEFAEMMRVFGLGIRPVSNDDAQGDCFEIADPSRTVKIDLACKLWRERKTESQQ